MPSEIFMTQFVIDPQLLLDAHLMGALPQSYVLLHKNAVLPWFILVPAVDVCDLLDLPHAALTAVMAEAALISSFVKQSFGCDKINFASIGNIVPQLHLHVVGRRPDDPCWPAPVWGNLRETREYSTGELTRIAGLLQMLAPQLVTR